MIEVSCAIIRNDDDKVLIVQRGEKSDHPYKWEFPGGKVKPGESYEDCIVREIDEELSLEIVISRGLNSLEYDYEHKKVRLFPFICDTLMDLPKLTEHLAFKWVDPDELEDFDFSEADIPLARDYAASYGNRKSGSNNKNDISEPDLHGIREMLSEKAGYGAIDLISDSAIESHQVLRVLFDYSLSDDTTLAFRSAYSLVKVSEKKKGLLKDYYGRMIEAMPSLSNESVIRSYLNILISAGVDGLNDREQGILADCCFNWLNNTKSAIAIKAYTMEIIYQLSEIYPELSVELVASIKRNMENGSAGVKARGRMILNRLRMS